MYITGDAPIRQFSIALTHPFATKTSWFSTTPFQPPQMRQFARKPSLSQKALLYVSGLKTIFDAFWLSDTFLAN